MSKKEQSDCQELKNIQYKSMLLNPNNPTSDFSSKNNTNIDMEKLLSNEQEYNKSLTWNKLDKCLRNTKLDEYAVKYCLDNKLKTEDLDILKIFLREKLDRKKIKGKDIIYDKSTGKITEITSLLYDKKLKTPLLKDGTSKAVSCKSTLAPPKKRQTKRSDKKDKRKSIKNNSRGTKSNESPTNNSWW